MGRWGTAVVSLVSFRGSARSSGQLSEIDGSVPITVCQRELPRTPAPSGSCSQIVLSNGATRLVASVDHRSPDSAARATVERLAGENAK